MSKFVPSRVFKQPRELPSFEKMYTVALGVIDDPHDREILKAALSHQKMSKEDRDHLAKIRKWLRRIAKKTCPVGKKGLSCKRKYGAGPSHRTPRVSEMMGCSCRACWSMHTWTQRSMNPGIKRCENRKVVSRAMAGKDYDGNVMLHTFGRCR